MKNFGFVFYFEEILFLCILGSEKETVCNNGKTYFEIILNSYSK